MVRRYGSALGVTHTASNGAESCHMDDAGGSASPFHLESYAHLLRRAPVPVDAGPGSAARAHDAANGGSVIDALVVPSVRSSDQLRPAIDLARQLRCRLIALYTDEFPDGLSQVLAEVQPGRASALALRSRAGRLLDVGSAVPPAPVPTDAVDISRKRNLGLLIGRSCAWTRMLFLDDDIRRVNPDDVSSAAALLSEYPVVGQQVVGFPDASVVGHARRLAGSGRKPFISGGSMLINPQRMRGYFPPVYHEDWLFVIDHLRLGEVAIAGTVAQLPYRPFTTKARARLEEFGDILAPGLLWLVHENGDSSASERDHWRKATGPQFWRDMLRQRITLLDDLHRRLEKLDRKVAITQPLESIRAAQDRCNELSPDEFVSFVENWLESLTAWRTRLASLHRADSVAQALAELGLRRAVIIHDERRSLIRTVLTRFGPRRMAP